MDRLISEQAVIDAIDKWVKNMGVLIALPANDVTPLLDSIHELPSVTQEPCDDAISREELLKAIDTWDRFGVDDTNSLFRLDNLSLPHYVPYIHYDDVVKCIKGMPSINPQPICEEREKGECPYYAG